MTYLGNWSELFTKSINLRLVFIILKQHTDNTRRRHIVDKILRITSEKMVRINNLEKKNQSVPWSIICPHTIGKPDSRII